MPHPTSQREEKIRSSIKMMIRDGINPFSIVAAHGLMVTPDEAALLKQYQKKLQKNFKKILSLPSLTQKEVE